MFDKNVRTAAFLNHAGNCKRTCNLFLKTLIVKSKIQYFVSPEWLGFCSCSLFPWPSICPCLQFEYSKKKNPVWEFLKSRMRFLSWGLLLRVSVCLWCWPVSRLILQTFLAVTSRMHTTDFMGAKSRQCSLAGGHLKDHLIKGVWFLNWA